MTTSNKVLKGGNRRFTKVNIAELVLPESEQFLGEISMGSQTNTKLDQRISVTYTLMKNTRINSSHANSEYYLFFNPLLN